MDSPLSELSSPPRDSPSPPRLPLPALLSPSLSPASALATLPAVAERMESASLLSHSVSPSPPPSSPRVSRTQPAPSSPVDPSASAFAAAALQLSEADTGDNGAQSAPSQLVSGPTGSTRPSAETAVDSGRSSITPAPTSPRPASPQSSSAVAVVAAVGPSPLRIKRRRSQRHRHGNQRLVNSAGEGSGSESESSTDQEQHRKHRAAVVEATVHRAQQMYEQLSVLRIACHQQHESIQQLSRQLKAVTAALQVATQPRQCGTCEHPLASLPGDSSSLLQSCLTSSAIAASLLLACRVGICGTDGLTGGTLDVNDELMHFCNYPPLHVLLATQPVVGWANVRSQAQMGRAVDEQTADNDSRVGIAADQYGRTWKGLWQLYAGEVDKSDAVWRCRHSPSEKFEMSCSAHVASWEEKDVDGLGELRRMPGRVVWVISILDAQRLD